MDKSKALYDAQALGTKARAYQDIAAGRFASEFGGDVEQTR